MFYKWIALLRGHPTHFDLVKQQRSEFINFYVYPQELDIEPCKFWPHNTHRLDTTIYHERVDLNNNADELKIMAQSLRSFISKHSGTSKIILVACGSLASKDSAFMSKLATILAKSHHKFVVAMADNLSKTLGTDNMWCASYVPQKQLLSMVDLLVCHGGNNSIVEAFHYGVPTLCIPFLFDNYDNARLVRDLGFGAMLYQECINETTLLSTIDKLVYDEGLRQRLKQISERIKSGNSVGEAAIKIELAYSQKLKIKN